MDILSIGYNFFEKNILPITLEEVPHFPFNNVKIILFDEKDKSECTTINVNYDENNNLFEFSMPLSKKEYFEIKADVRDIKFNGEYLCNFSQEHRKFQIKHRNSSGKIVFINNYKEGKALRIVQFFHASLQIFDYINSIKLDLPEIKKVEVKPSSFRKIFSPKQKAEHKVYLQRTFTITGCERKRRKKSTVVYSTAEWGVRGHMRHMKNGKTVWIKPHTRKRKNLTGDTKSKKNYIVA